jgi:hypothetical protein
VPAAQKDALRSEERVDTGAAETCVLLRLGSEIVVPNQMKNPSENM